MNKKFLFQWHVLVPEIPSEREITYSRQCAHVDRMDSGGGATGRSDKEERGQYPASLGNQLYEPWGPGWPTGALNKPVFETPSFLPV